MTRRQLLQGTYTHLAGFADTDLGQLPKVPKLSILATSMKTGKLVAFSRDGFYDGENLHPSTNVKLAFAVAASSAFPPLFPPIELSASDLELTPEQLKYTPDLLTDGGVYDNLGLTKLLENVALRAHEEACDLVFVSDASAPFEWSESDNYSLIVSRTFRTTDILMKRVAELEERKYQAEASAGMSANPYVVPINIEMTVTPEDLGAIPELSMATYQLQDFSVQKRVARVRTDLDDFSVEEMCSLVRHGYEVALKEIARLNLLPPNFSPRDPCGVPFPRIGFAHEKPANDAHDKYLRNLSDSQAIEHLRKALHKSAKRRLGIFRTADPLCVALVVIPALVVVCALAYWLAASEIPIDF